MMKKIRLLLAIVCCMAICGTVALAQSFLYYPHVYTAAQVNRMAKSANLQRWTNAIGVNIGFKRPSPTQPAGGSVLILYGNGSTATACARYANDLQKVAAMDVYILEYPGYEDRPGTPSELSIFTAASDGLQMIPSKNPIYLIGASLGSGVASYLAGTTSNRVAGVVLLSPFANITDVAQYLFPGVPVSSALVDRYPSEEYLRSYRGKVGITVDGKDTIVPEQFGLRLYRGYDGPKKLWKFPNGTHCEITNPQTDFWKQAVAFWQGN